MSEHFEVAVYNSSESDAEAEAESIETSDPKSTRRRVFTWIYKQTFENPSDAKKWIEEQRVWSHFHSYDTVAGRKDQYRCNLVPYRGVQRAAAIHLIYNSDSYKVTLFATPEDHDHDQINHEKRRGNRLIS